MICRFFTKNISKVNHVIICRQLRVLGMCGNLGEWQDDFLKETQQAIVTNGDTQVETQMTCGAANRTVMVPQLFIVVDSYMPSAIQMFTVASYIDDIKVSQKLQNSGNFAHLYRELDSIHGWAGNMQLIASKFQHLCCQHKKLNDKHTGYTGLRRCAIPESKSVHDMGNAILKIKCRWLDECILPTFKSGEKEGRMVVWMFLSSAA